MAAFLLSASIRRLSEFIGSLPGILDKSSCGAIPRLTGVGGGLGTNLIICLELLFAGLVGLVGLLQLHIRKLL
jgi:hypothetical protein